MKEMEIEQWQQRRLHRSPKPQKKRKTTSQRGDSQDEDSHESDDQELKGKNDTNAVKKVVTVVSPKVNAVE